ncbi:MAG: M4 family metallopeptidase [Flavobacteriales bacterium]
MKKTVLIAFIFICSIGFSQNSNTEGKFSEILSHAKEVKKIENSNIPVFIEFGKGHSIQLNEVETFLNSFSRTKFSLKEVNTTEDHIGFTHIKYQQVINSIPVELSHIGVHIKSNVIVSISGNFTSKQVSSSTASISENTALNNALSKINAKKYKWQIPEEEEFIKKDKNDPEATFFPKGNLVYLEINNELRLSYVFNIYAHEPLSRNFYYVDAINGKIIFKNDIIHHTDVPGTASTGYSGTRIITTDSFATTPTNYRLRESGRGNGIETYDMNTGTNYGSAVDFTDNDNNWTDTTNGDHYALDAHWGAEMTYDYFWNVHARNSIDGSGFKLKSYIHYNNNYVNAFWDGSRMTYGDGNGTSTSPLTTMAIAGHEITHGLTSNTANLVYSYESGALNESFSDIFGVAIDFWSRPTLADWEMGDEIYITGSSYFRSMSNPNARNDPDTYLGTHWYTGTGDNGGVHTNSGVQNFWFYLLVNGGTGTNDIGNAYTVAPLGFDTASRIAFRNLTVYLGRNSQHSDARFYAIKSAIDLYGACSPVVEAVTNAWYAVGVGGPYVAGVQSNFISSDTLGCKVPHTVNFTNNSNSNATAFIWDFGDGNTSTANNPTHTYTGYGPYTVKLYANGGACGDDTLTIVDFIKIDTNLNCPDIITLAKNTSMSSTNCFGTLYDDGGPSGNYTRNQNSFFRISPASAVNITLNFTHFDVESGDIGTTCNYDYLEVYDGPTATATLLGRYCNNNTPPPSLTSSTGDLYIKFHTDGGLHLSGFKLDWTCTQHTSPLPLAAFTENDTNICTSESITYTNNSFNATSYAWSFPGGTPSTSTAVNPVVTYNTGGTYTTRLIATNSFGSDTTYQVIIVNGICPVILPGGGTAPVQTSCRGKLIDDGGLTGDYSPNQTTYVTVAPTSAVNVTFDFKSFDVEADNCIYDYMMIYDGPNTASPLIGKYCNSSLPPSPLTSSGNALTVKFYADAGLELDGFEIDWYCSLVGLSEIDKINKVKIYPNPSTDFVTVEVDFNQTNNLNIKIIDLLGKTLYENSSADQALQFTDKIDVSDFASGTYIIYVNNQAHKFVKQ